MELRQLQYFVAVAEEANFTRAAQRVHISQSGVSAQIRQLEHEVGAVLIDRSGRRATVTPAGAVLLEHARAVLASVQGARQAIDDVNGLVRGRLVVGMVTACTVTPLFDALSTFHCAYPGIELALYEDNSDRLVEDVRAGRADLALIGAAGEPPPGLASRPIISERLVAVVAADHPLAKRRRVKLAEVADYPLVCMPTGTGIRAVFDQGCAALGIEPEIALQASAPGAIADLARRGLGVAILSQTTAAANDELLTSVVIDDIKIPALLLLVWSNAATPALQELLRHAQKSFAAT